MVAFKASLSKLVNKATPGFNCTLLYVCELHGSSHLMLNGGDSDETALLDEVSIAGGKTHKISLFPEACLATGQPK